MPSTSTTTVQRPIHFLLVEDEQAHAELVLMSLDDNQVTNTIEHVTDGELALAYLRNEGVFAESTRPDVILLDLKLPKVDGLEVLEQIKADEQLCTIPVVILTTSANEADREKAYKHHVNSFVTKPVDFSKFQQMVKDLSLYWTVWNQPPVSS